MSFENRAMVIATHPTTGIISMAMSASIFTEQNAAAWREQGHIVETVTYSEYESRSSAFSD